MVLGLGEGATIALGGRAGERPKETQTTAG